MRIVVAPDSLKDSLDAHAAAEAISQGALAAGQEVGVDLDVVSRPISDGGEGFISCLQQAIEGDLRSCSLTGPLGEPRDARWLYLPQCPPGASLESMRYPVGIIEIAQACGLELIPDARRDPERTTTYGVGELILAARTSGCRDLLVGLGGSATCDGGVGALAALGVKFTGTDGAQIDAPVGADLTRIERIQLEQVRKDLADLRVTFACDVNNPLLGAHGSARTFAPQKGASPEQVERLERGLDNLVTCLRDIEMQMSPDASGAGAAGGLGFGLAACLQSKFAPGASLAMDFLGLPGLIEKADLVITAEGRLDASSLDGKGPLEVAQLACHGGVPALLLAGEITEDDESRLRIHRAAPTISISGISADPASTRGSRQRSTEALRQTTQELVSGWLESRD